MANPSSPSGHSAGLPMREYYPGCGNAGMNLATNDVSHSYGAYCKVTHGMFQLNVFPFSFILLISKYPCWSVKLGQLTSFN